MAGTLPCILPPSPFTASASAGALTYGEYVCLTLINNSPVSWESASRNKE